MAIELKGSETEKNLLKSFAGESQARNRYTYFASVAKKEGYVQISEIFTETAGNEKEHAEIFFKFLNECAGEALEITASYPSGRIGHTIENLQASADGEHEEWEILYPNFADTAREEGFEDIAEHYEAIAKVEAEHEARYRKLLANVKDGTVFKKEKVVRWKCKNCGYVHEGAEAPEVCPACDHPQAHYEVLAENY